MYRRHASTVTSPSETLAVWKCCVGTLHAAVAQSAPHTLAATLVASCSTNVTTANRIMFFGGPTLERESTGPGEAAVRWPAASTRSGHAPRTTGSEEPERTVKTIEWRVARFGTLCYACGQMQFPEVFPGFCCLTYQACLREKGLGSDDTFAISESIGPCMSSLNS